MSQEQSTDADSRPIRVFLRVKPCQSHIPLSCSTLPDEPEKIVFSAGPRMGGGNVVFGFDGILQASCDQEEVFHRVAEGAVKSAIEGINSTLFAYGQTGTGKTYTMSGGALQYKDRGIIPRAISRLFDLIHQKTQWQVSVHISYLEIYNNEGYDLLDHNEDISDLSHLQKVSLLENGDGQFVTQNLSYHLVQNEEEALNLLFTGETNRAVAETPLNQASSRSHSVFTLHTEARERGSEIMLKSKLNLVDLAGSERIHKAKTQAGVLLREACNINLSLHHLERVILALHGQGQQHVPYRDSMLTSLLRDSLGGNTVTTMITTLTPDRSHVEESISACRFAMRVAQISNTFSVNTEIDPTVTITRLRAQIRELKDEITLLRGGDGDMNSELREYEKRKCVEAIDTFLNADVNEPSCLPLDNIHWIRFMFQILREQQTKTGPKAAKVFPERLSPQSDSTKLETELVIGQLHTLPMEGGGGSIKSESETEHPDSGGEVGGVVGRAELFERFKQDSGYQQAWDANKAQLETLHTRAAGLEEQILAWRTRIDATKRGVSELRQERAMLGLLAGNEPDEEEGELMAILGEAREGHRKAVGDMRRVRAEVMAVTSLMQRTKAVIERDFEVWAHQAD